LVRRQSLRQLAYDNARNTYLLHVPPGRKRL
jgi:hypothetical protein